MLDVNPIVTENCKYIAHQPRDNFTKLQSIVNIEYYKCDVSKWEEVEAAAKKIQEELGHPTVLINNAGVVQGKTILDLTPEDIQQ